MIFFFRTLLITVVVRAWSCPDDITAFRTDAVIESFDPAKLSGLWYEQAYIDLAQVGESCQVFNNTILGEDGGIDQKFHVIYGFIPYTLPLHYDIQDQPGVFDRYAKYPGGQWLKFPSIVVDFTTDAAGNYVTLSEYLCYSLLGIEYVEIRLSTREASVSSDIIDSMESVVSAQGIEYDSLTYVNQTGCDVWP